MQTYLVFMRNKDTNEEFVVPHNGAENSHERIKIEVRNKYPANKFDIFTAYTLEDLENTLTETKRWPGVASKPQKEAIRNNMFAVSTATPKAKASSYEIEAMLKAKSIASQAQVTNRKAIKSTIKPNPATTNKSVVEILKAIRA